MRFIIYIYPKDIVDLLSGKQLMVENSDDSPTFLAFKPIDVAESGVEEEQKP